MSNIRRLRRRISSTRNLAQVTRAMQAVSASKLRKAQHQMQASRAYTVWLHRILENLGKSGAAFAGQLPLLASPEKVDHVLGILFTSDRGLCGSYNQNIIHKTIIFARQQVEQGRQIHFITIGQKGPEALSSFGYDLVGHFDMPRTNPSYGQAQELAHMAMDAFVEDKYQEVWLMYTHFENALTQHSRVQRYLPIGVAAAQENAIDFIFEPSLSSVLEDFLLRALEMELYQAWMESETSEHAARMVSMENATRNADNLVEELTLRYNKARQQGITREILDIAGGAEALRRAREQP